MQKKVIRPGEIYGRLSILEEAETKNNRRYFLCRCICGKEKVIQLYHFLSGKTKSCGCYHKEKQIEWGRKVVHKMIETLQTHGQSKTRIYRIFRNMKNRCEWKKHKEYKYWGGKGVIIEWKDFEEFYKDMSESYSEHCKINGERNTTIDRIDGNGNYCKKNCRWATYKVQANNKSPN